MIKAINLIGMALLIALAGCKQTQSETPSIPIIQISTPESNNSEVKEINLNAFNFFVAISYPEFTEQDLRDSETMSFVFDRFMEDNIFSSCAENAGIVVDNKTIDNFIQLELTNMTFKLQTEEQQNMYRKEIKRRLLIKNFLHSQVLAKIKVTDDEIEAYYLKNQSLYTKEKQYCIRQVQLETKELADKFRMEYSKGNKSFKEHAEKTMKGNEHELAPCLPLNSFPEPFQRSIRKMKPGSISKVLKLDYGDKTLYHVLMLERIIPEVDYSLEETASNIKRILEKRQIERRLAEMKGDFKKKHRIQILHENLPFTYLKPENRRRDS